MVNLSLQIKFCFLYKNVDDFLRFCCGDFFVIQSLALMFQWKILDSINSGLGMSIVQCPTSLKGGPLAGLNVASCEANKVVTKIVTSILKLKSTKLQNNLSTKEKLHRTKFY